MEYAQYQAPEKLPIQLPSDYYHSAYPPPPPGLHPSPTPSPYGYRVEPYRPLPPGPPPVGPPPPTASPPPTPYYYPGLGSGQLEGARRKPVRAALACDACRQRKAKCDEGRPECSHCKDHGLKCSYREIPPQKSEKSSFVYTLDETFGNLQNVSGSPLSESFMDWYGHFTMPGFSQTPPPRQGYAISPHQAAAMATAAASGSLHGLYNQPPVHLSTDSVKTAARELRQQIRTMSSRRENAQSPRISGSNITRSHLPLAINGLTENAVADTGAHENVISESLAKRLKLKVHKAGGEAHQFMNAVGKRMTAIGYAQVPCTFQDQSQQSVTSRFWVFPKLIVPLVVGRNFLESTETLTRFKHRLQNLVISAGISLRVLHMELPRWRLNCTIDSLPTLANPDSGSDLDLMSLSFVQQNGFNMKQVQRGKGYIQFADGTIQRLKGVVSVPFSIGHGRDGHHNHEFYVLDGLTSEVLLGNNTLTELDAFDTYGHEFVDLEEYDEYSDFQFIRWVQRNGEGDFLDAPFHEFQFSSVATGPLPSAASPPKQSTSKFNFLRLRRRRPQQETVLTIAESEARSQRYLQFKDVSEQRRRTQEETRISELDPRDQPSAERAEHARQEKYDRDRADFVARHTAAISLLKSSSNPPGAPSPGLVAGPTSP